MSRSINPISILCFERCLTSQRAMSDPLRSTEMSKTFHHVCRDYVFKSTSLSNIRSWHISHVRRFFRRFIRAIKKTEKKPILSIENGITIHVKYYTCKKTPKQFDLILIWLYCFWLRSLRPFLMFLFPPTFKLGSTYLQVTKTLPQNSRREHYRVNSSPFFMKRKSPLMKLVQVIDGSILHARWINLEH